VGAEKSRSIWELAPEGFDCVFFLEFAFVPQDISTKE
jgi:hypothetical protein